MANQGVLAGTGGPAPVPPKTTDQLRADAERNKYPAWVRPSKDAPKVLVHDEAEHRAAAPHDFEAAEAADEGKHKGKK